MSAAVRCIRPLKLFPVILLGLIVVALFRIVVVLYDPPSDAIKVSGPVNVLQGGELYGKGSFPVFVASGNDASDSPGTYIFEMTMNDSALSCDDPVLVVPLIRGNSVSARINGVYVGGYGDSVNGDSSIWNSAFFFRIPVYALLPANKVSIEIHGLSLTGILKRPFIVDGDQHRWRLFVLSLLANFLPWLFLGAGLLLGLIITSASLLSMPRVDGQLFIGLICVLTGLLFADYAQIEYLPISYLLFNKMLVSARHAYFAIFPLAVIPYIKKKVSPFIIAFGGAQVLCIALVFAIPRDVPSLERLCAYTYLTAIPLVPYLLVLLLKHGKKNREFLILISGVSVAFSTAFLDFINLQFDRNAPYMSHYGFGILVFCVSLVVIRTMLSQYGALIEEQRRATLFFADATHDALTGAFNRKILPTVANSLPDFFSVIFIDLDDFKIVNDTFGHATGDEVLKDLTLIIRHYIRTDDTVIRFGGDEFIVVLQNCLLEKAEALANRIGMGISSSGVPCPDGSTIAYTSSIGVAQSGPITVRGMKAIMDTIERADAAAYRSKRAGKNRVTADRVKP